MWPMYAIHQENARFLHRASASSSCTTFRPLAVPCTRQAAMSRTSRMLKGALLMRCPADETSDQLFSSSSVHQRISRSRASRPSRRAAAGASGRSAYFGLTPTRTGWIHPRTSWAGANRKRGSGSG